MLGRLVGLIEKITPFSSPETFRKRKRMKWDKLKMDL
jgi:hypothetical protein